jgi:hypothetical protein
MDIENSNDGAKFTIFDKNHNLWYRNDIEKL